MDPLLRALSLCVLGAGLACGARAPAGAAPAAIAAPAPTPQPAPQPQPQPIPPATDPRGAAIEGLFHAVDSSDRPGCAVAVSQHGATRFARGYGLANLDYRIRNTPATAFYVASVAKQVTALAIQLLVHDGKLSLHDEVRRYLPELPDYGAPVRIEHLVHHTSGIRDYSILSGIAGMRYDDLVTVDDAMRFIVRQHQLNFPPGERFAYSNSGYFLLARIVEKVSGTSLRDFAQDRIFGPLGMTHTQYRADHGSIIPDRATGYTETPAGLRVAHVNGDAVGQGGLYASADDLMRWATQIFEARLGGPEVRQAQLTSGKLSSGIEIGYGHGLFLGQLLGRPMIEHSGGVPGYNADVVYEPETQTAVAVLCNTDAVSAAGLAPEVARLYLDAAPPADAAPPPDAATPDRAEDLDGYVGTFWDRNAGNVVRYEIEAGGLREVFSGAPAHELRALGDGRFRRKDAPVLVAFQPRKAGLSPGATRQREGQLAAHWVRAEPPDTAPAHLARYAGVYRNEELEVTWQFLVQGNQLVVRPPRAIDVVKLAPVFRDAFVDPDGELWRFDGRRWLLTDSRTFELAFTRQR